MSEADLDPAMRLAVSVIRRARAGECVELIEMVLKRFEATPHRCHDNVREWVAMHPELEHVRGFLVANQAEIDTSLVISHSVVGVPKDGTVRDITPNDAKYRYPFVRHIGTLEEFELIAGKEPFMLEVPNALLRKLGVI